MSDVIGLMMALGRSGGTLLNRMLTLSPDAVVLSEVHPFGSAQASLAEQAEDWYGIALSSRDFVEQIRDLASATRSRGRRIIIREWTHLNYFEREQNRHDPPRVPLTYELLAAEFPLQAFAFVRDPIDVWLSYQVRYPAMNIEVFFRGYRLHVEDLLARDIPIFRFEDLARSPQSVVGDICEVLHVAKPTDLSQAFKVRKVSGDPESRGLGRRRVVRLKRRGASQPEIDRIDANTDMRHASALLGYPASYGGREVEGPYDRVLSAASTWRRKGMNRIRQLLIGGSNR